MTTPSLSTAKKVGDFLRWKREQLSPEQAGLVAGSRRRTPGLRREEVAQLSYVSTTWYTWLEQGRGISVSARTLGGIATALQLAKAEREYLFNLAELTDPHGQLPMANAPNIVGVVESVKAPCYVMDIAWRLVAWNRAAEDLFSGWLSVDPAPNMLEFIFTHPLARQLVVDWPGRAQRIVAELRAESIHLDSHAPLKATVDALQEKSEEFATWWANYYVVLREGGKREFNHPQQGRCQFQQTTWQLSPESGTKMIILIAQEEIDDAPAE